MALHTTHLKEGISCELCFSGEGEGFRSRGNLRQVPFKLKTCDLEIPIGDRVSHFLSEWEKINDDQLVLSSIKHWYKLESKNIFIDRCKIDSFQCKI